MTDTENPTQPLINHQAAVNVGEPAERSSSTKAYKVAGLTLFIGALVVSQALIGYFLLSQRSDIKSLEEQSKNMKMEVSRGQSASVPMKMHIPMNALANMMDESVDAESSTGSPESAAPLTTCQLEAAGLKPIQVPGFRPECDQRGLYRAQQCFFGQCWCVNTVTGEQIPGSLKTGQASCTMRLLPSHKTAMLTVSDVTA